MFPSALLIEPSVEARIVDTQAIEKRVALVDRVGFALRHIGQLNRGGLEGLPQPDQRVFKREHVVAEPNPARAPLQAHVPRDQELCRLSFQAEQKPAVTAVVDGINRAVAAGQLGVIGIHDVLEALELLELAERDGAPRRVRVALDVIVDSCVHEQPDATGAAAADEISEPSIDRAVVFQTDHDVRVD